MRTKSFAWRMLILIAAKERNSLKWRRARGCSIVFKPVLPEQN
jgi:hypothetical protein